MDAEEIYHRLRAEAEQYGFVDDAADEHLADAARVMAEDPRNQEGAEPDPIVPPRVEKRDGVRFRNGQPHYDMYTLAGNQLVSQLVSQLRADMAAGNVSRNELLGRAAGVLVDVDKAGHHEIYDTEPPWAVTDALNDTCQQLGWQPITKEDFA